MPLWNPGIIQEAQTQWSTTPRPFLPVQSRVSAWYIFLFFKTKTKKTITKTKKHIIRAQQKFSFCLALGPAPTGVFLPGEQKSIW